MIGGVCSNRGARWRLTGRNAGGDGSIGAGVGECLPKAIETVPEAGLVVRREVEVGIGV